MVDADDSDRNAYAALSRDPNYKFVPAEQLIKSLGVVGVTPVKPATVSDIKYRQYTGKLPNTTSVTLFCNHHSMNVASFDELKPVRIDETTYHECELRLPFDQQVKPQNLEHFCILSAAENAPFIVHPTTMKSMVYLFSGDGNPVTEDSIDHDNDEVDSAKYAVELLQSQLSESRHGDVDKMLASFFTDAITRGRQKYLNHVLPVAKKFWDSAGIDPKLKNTTACLLELLRCDVAYPLTCFDRATPSYPSSTIHVPLYRVASFNPYKRDKFITGTGDDAMQGWSHRHKDNVVLNLSVRIDVVHDGQSFSILLALDNEKLKEPHVSPTHGGNVHYFIGDVMKMMYDPYFYTYLKNLFQSTQDVISDWLRFTDGIPDGIPVNLLVWILDLNCKVTQHIVERVKRSQQTQKGFILTNTHSLPHVDHNGIRRLFYRSTDKTIWVLKVLPAQPRLNNVMLTDPASSSPTVLHVHPTYMDLPTTDTEQAQFLQVMEGFSFDSMRFSMPSSTTQTLSLTDVVKDEDPKFKLDVDDLPSELGLLPSAVNTGGSGALGNPGASPVNVNTLLQEIPKNTWRSSFFSKVIPFLSAGLSMASSLFSHGGRRVLHHHSLNKSKKRRGRRTVRTYYRPGLSYRKISRRARGRSRSRRGRSRRNPKN